MIELEGKLGKAKVFTDLVEETAIGQIIGMLSHEITEGTQVRIMPDCHAGKGTTIGTTIKLPDDFADWKVCPNVVGFDVGCGISMVKLSAKTGEVNLAELDKQVNKLIPSGFNIHYEKADPVTKAILDNLSIDLGNDIETHIVNSLGTLGGGNHFIELGIDDEGSYWLSVHSGSRNLGVQVARAHQKAAIASLQAERVEEIDIPGVIKKLKDEGKHKEIEKTLVALKKKHKSLSLDQEELAYLTGDLLKDYLNDMALAQEFASENRKKILNTIVESMDFKIIDKFDSIHNFIEHDNYTKGLIRKGATSANKGERLVIPLNMRDGSLICIGKGNADWNESAPHGAGRVMSRSKARKNIDVDKFVMQMTDVYSSTVCESTIDEAPDAYKPEAEIIDNIKPTVDIVTRVHPVYNFKSI